MSLEPNEIQPANRVFQNCLFIYLNGNYDTSWRILNRISLIRTITKDIFYCSFCILYWIIISVKWTTNELAKFVIWKIVGCSQQEINSVEVLSVVLSKRNVFVSIYLFIYLFCFLSTFQNHCEFLKEKLSLTESIEKNAPPSCDSYPDFS